MKLDIDNQANAVCLHLIEGEFHEMRKAGPNVNFDMTADGRIIGIEVLNARSFFGDLENLPEADVISRLLLADRPIAKAA
ncbi:MAG TPA: DUF2283 domain-containing protein [Capsulimonadaceae bacterium]|jgi:uncharacterized protein YuzE